MIALLHMTAFLSRTVLFVDCQFGSIVTRALKEEVNSLEMTGNALLLPELELLLIEIPTPLIGFFGETEHVGMFLEPSLISDVLLSGDDWTSEPSYNVPLSLLLTSG